MTLDDLRSKVAEVMRLAADLMDAGHLVGIGQLGASYYSIYPVVDAQVRLGLPPGGAPGGSHPSPITSCASWAAASLNGGRPPTKDAANVYRVAADAVEEGRFDDILRRFGNVSEEP